MSDQQHVTVTLKAPADAETASSDDKPKQTSTWFVHLSAVLQIWMHGPKQMGQNKSHNELYASLFYTCRLDTSYHNITAMVGAGVLGLPATFATLGWAGGLIVLVASLGISWFTFGLLVHLHEVSGDEAHF